MSIAERVKEQAAVLFARFRDIEGVLMSSDQYRKMQEQCRKRNGGIGAAIIFGIKTPFGDLRLLNTDYRKSGVFVVDEFGRDWLGNLHTW